MIRVAVIGVGAMGRNHARVYSELAEADLVAVADENQTLARSVGTNFGSAAYDDYRQDDCRNET